MKTIKTILGIILILLITILVLIKANVIKLGISNFESTKRFQKISNSPITTLKYYLSNPNDSILLPRNKTILLNFWATWCGPCRKEIPMLNALKERYETQDILFLSTCINIKEDSVDEALKEFEKSYNLKRIELKEGALSSLIKLAATYNPTIDTAHAPLPSTFIIRDDSICFYFNHYIQESDTNALVKLLR